MPPVGALFRVLETLEFREGEQVVARYLPDHGPYVVTQRNAAFVERKLATRQLLLVGGASAPPSGSIDGR